MSREFDALCNWFESLTPQTLLHIGDYYTADAHFKDPFNELQGIQGVQRVFAHMFETLQAPTFKITDRMCQDGQGFVVWEFHFVSSGRAMCLRGSSHLKFDARGRVAVHRDYWDAAEELYEKIPVLGILMRALRRKLAVKT